MHILVNILHISLRHLTYGQTFGLSTKRTGFKTCVAVLNPWTRFLFYIAPGHLAV